jgi:hypothetical protein
MAQLKVSRDGFGGTGGQASSAPCFYCGFASPAYLPQNMVAKNSLAQTQITYTTNPNNSYYE